MARALALLVAIAGVPSLARAQGDAPGQPGLGEIQIDVIQLGVGGQFRPGSWAGVQVRVNDLGLEQRNVVLRVRGTDADGDHPLYDRVITTNPGVAQAFWLYMRVPYALGPGDEITVRAHAAVDSGGETGFRAGQILGSVTKQMVQRVNATDSVIGVVNELPLGLTAYQSSTGTVTWPATAHDIMWVASDLRVSALPDRWQGLAVLDALVWGRGSGPTDPGLMTPEQALAIERWVERGGHLIVMLPSSGQEWTGQASNRLRRLLPAMEVPVRHEGVNLEPYRPLFTTERGVRLPAKAAVHELVPLPEAEAGQATRVLTSPEGWCVVMRRSVGAGAVTVIGVDLAANEFRAGQMPQPEPFWHRVLGRRGQIYSEQELTVTGSPLRSEIQGRNPVSFDDDLEDEIAKAGRAVQGVLFGLVLFVLYWIIAGPAGYIILAKRKMKHLAWPAFVATTAAFTAIAWTGAAAMRPKRTTGAHVTYLEQVHGQEFQRARSWVSVLVPRYGSAEIRVGAVDAGEGDLIAPWAGPGTGLGTVQTFPDNRDYTISARDPSAMTAPTRATVKQVQVDWAGEDRLGMIQPMARVLGDPRVLELRDNERRSGQYVEGLLVHELPGALEDVVIVVIERQRPVRSAPLNNQTVSIVSGYNLTGRWEPGLALDLADMTSREPGARAAATAITGDDFLKNYLARGRSRTSGATDSGGRPDRLTAVRFFSQLEPANLAYTRAKNHVARRVASQGWDLGRWFTQPCVIVVGHLVTEPGDASAEASPVPLTVDGREVPMSGRTVISWIYPLHDNPPEWAGLRAAPAGEGGADDAAEGNADEG
ncbi:MAG: hypothetical protein DHS20C14_02240 [Phycisphaeraceae bacterium]|nr:MAG: hypothetical protein DHS20C14_02240 [Phycisphaeraceae bacterium]